MIGSTEATHNYGVYSQNAHITDTYEHIDIAIIKKYTTDTSLIEIYFFHRRKPAILENKNAPNDNSEGQDTRIGQTEFLEPEEKQAEIHEINLAQIDIVTSEKTITMSAPVQEFEDF